MSETKTPDENLLNSLILDESYNDPLQLLQHWLSLLSSTKYRARRMIDTTCYLTLHSMPYKQVAAAAMYAWESHDDTNHTRDDHSYFTLHLFPTYMYGEKYKHLLGAPMHVPALSGCFVHDAIEDARQTYNDVKEVCGRDVAEIARALSNDIRGRVRKERADDSYYTGIIGTPGARFVKLCDRLSNIAYSKAKGGRMLKMYEQEHMQFSDYLFHDRFKPMFDEMEAMF